MKDTKLSSSYTVRKYKELKLAQDRDNIAELIYERFFERYIRPFESNSNKHGFSMMAVSCLMIEALHSFKNGWKRTRGKGGVAFENFFSNSTHFKEFFGTDVDFYSNIRCGILHQAETNAGWKIIRKGPLLDKSQKTINATKFMVALKRELYEYTSNMKREPFDSVAWKKAIQKLDYVCENCIA